MVIIAKSTRITSTFQIAILSASRVHDELYVINCFERQASISFNYLDAFNYYYLTTKTGPSDWMTIYISKLDIQNVIMFIAFVNL